MRLQIETRNRFRCLRSKPVDIEEKKIESDVNEQIQDSQSTEPVARSPKTQCFQEREIFHDTFSFLIRLVLVCMSVLSQCHSSHFCLIIL